MFQNWTYLAVLLVGFCCWTLVVVGVDSLTDPVEVKALQDIKKSLIDSNKILSNWNRGDPCTSNWTGVLCFNTTKEGYLHVSELQLLNMNLSGQLSPELGRLSYLEILDFMWNSITGPIPKEIGNITSLFLLLLNGNQLTGFLPEELGYLRNLDRIQIDQNFISGPIPKSFANLNNIKHFHMNNNSISGQIPPELSRLPNLVHFLLDNNNLSGYLPPEFSDLPSLLILQLDNNNFEGTLIPDSYSNMSKLLKLSLRNCRLQGQIPDLSRIPNLGYLDLSSNRLNGSLPQGQLSSNITTINLSNNNLTGTIPATFTSLPNLQRLWIANNSLDGSVPSTLWQNRILNANETLTLDFENNYFINISGSPSLPPIVTLWLQGNPLCSNTNLDKICGSTNDEESNMQVSTYPLSVCNPFTCPSPYEYSQPSNVTCFCAAPLFAGYRLKSPGFSYFRQYRTTFENYITEGLDLYTYQLDLVTFTWQSGPRLIMYLKLFPVYEVNNRAPHLFNDSEVRRIRSMFTGWLIPDSDLFGPYELLKFTLSVPYLNDNIDPMTQPIARWGQLSEKKWVIIIVTCAIFVLGVLVLGCIIFMRKRKRRIQGNTDNSRDIFNKNNEGSKEDDMELLIYDLQTIAKATDNFANKNKLGEGGFGPVYKGTLMEGQEIAIKRLSKCSGQGIDEFKNEVILIAKLQHRNLVKLLGCCTQRDERMLIYEYMPNKSLDYFIFDKTRRELLDWGKRIQIIGGIARGLLYLHQDSRLRIIHRDLKASNVLLDNEMNPKISDFGLAKTFRGDQTRGETNRVVGTYGYMSPEYAIDGIFSVKSDIFSFGVLVLEMVSGKRNRGFCHTDHNHNLLGHAWTLWNEERAVELIDEQLDYSCTSSEILRCIHVSLLCVQQRPEDRPNMSTVALMLGGEGSLPRPRQPGFFTERYPTEPEITINEITISLLEPR